MKCNDEINLHLSHRYELGRHHVFVRTWIGESISVLLAVPNAPDPRPPRAPREMLADARSVVPEAIEREPISRSVIVALTTSFIAHSADIRDVHPSTAQLGRGTTTSISMT